MDPLHLFLLGTAGLLAGFLAGLIGVGGGVIFAPVLLVYFQSLDLPPEVVAPLTLGSSLFCTLITAASTAWFQDRRGFVLRRVALHVGLYSAVVTILLSQLVTTQPWYSARVFQVVFSLVLITVAARMLLNRRPEEYEMPAGASRETFFSPLVLATTGTVAGAVATAAGVGGGVVLVPAYTGPMRIPVKHAMGTSSATIVLVSLAGMLAYLLSGLGADVPPTAIGYVDVGHALFLAVPSIFSSRLGVWAAHRMNTRALRIIFAVIAILVSLRLLWKALLG